MNANPSPAEQLRAKALAAKEAGNAEGNDHYPRSQYNLMLSQLAQYKQRLKAIKATSQKEAVKRDEMLPEMRAYVEGVLESDAGMQDDVLVTYMIWALDAGDIDECLRVGEYVMKHDLVMPEQFERDTADWLAEEVAIRTIKAHEAGQALDNSAFTVWSWVKDLDLFDQVAAKIHKAMGLVLHDQKPDQALKHYKQAYELWSRIGTKKLADQLEKQLTSNNS